MTIDNRFEHKGKSYCLAQKADCKYFDSEQKICFAGQYEEERINYFGCGAREMCRYEKKHETKRYCFVRNQFKKLVVM